QVLRHHPRRRPGMPLRPRPRPPCLRRSLVAHRATPRSTRRPDLASRRDPPGPHLHPSAPRPMPDPARLGPCRAAVLTPTPPPPPARRAPPCSRLPARGPPPPGVPHSRTLASQLASWLTVLAPPGRWPGGEPEASTGVRGDCPPQDRVAT